MRRCVSALKKPLSSRPRCRTDPLRVGCRYLRSGNLCSWRAGGLGAAVGIALPTRILALVEAGKPIRRAARDTGIVGARTFRAAFRRHGNGRGSLCRCARREKHRKQHGHREAISHRHCARYAHLGRPMPALTGVDVSAGSPIAGRHDLFMPLHPRRQRLRAIGAVHSELLTFPDGYRRPESRSSAWVRSPSRPATARDRHLGARHTFDADAHPAVPPRTAAAQPRPS